MAEYGWYLGGDYDAWKTAEPPDRPDDDEPEEEEEEDE